jgi:hypothetical protein
MILAKARAAGVFQNPEYVKYLQDPTSALAGLYSRADFQKLRAEVEGR